ncbi:MAG: hypothetical protein DMG60_13810 [Acidobacteria bacterium]|nr:MAG: hypothetical protein DMG60_13810 [Acidobacteriota bacterium]
MAGNANLAWPVPHPKGAQFTSPVSAIQIITNYPDSDTAAGCLPIFVFSSLMKLESEQLRTGWLLEWNNVLPPRQIAAGFWRGEVRERLKRAASKAFPKSTRHLESSTYKPDFPDKPVI